MTGFHDCEPDRCNYCGKMHPTEDCPYIPIIGDHKMSNDKQTGPQPPNFYTIHMPCSNCGHACRVEIPRGTEVSSHVCPNCGCRTLKRSWNSSKHYSSEMAEAIDLFFNRRRS